MDRSEFRYTENYCEENIYHLASEPRFADASTFVVFISNAERRVAMTCQRSRPQGVVIWDYHVILLVRSRKFEVWDLDTDLAFPCAAVDYLRDSFPADIPDMFAPRFRLVPADRFIADFASDRRHMKDGSGGFLFPPPQWPAINPERGSNLEELIDPGETRFGPTMRLNELVELAGS